MKPRGICTRCGKDDLVLTKSGGTYKHNCPHGNECGRDWTNFERSLTGPRINDPDALPPRCKACPRTTP